MKHLDEYRDRELAENLIRQISGRVTRPWNIMEICGGQTHSIMKYGLHQLLPRPITLIHGPGCPVCVTPVSLIDMAIRLAREQQVTLASFGDMLRVPGTGEDLLSAKAQGADIRTVYSPLDSVSLAAKDPGREVVFFAVGFETTAPAVALAVLEAAKKQLSNYSVLAAHVLVPPAIRALLSAPDHSIDGFLAAGHVCTIMGYEQYIPIAEEFGIPMAVTGFEPVDLLLGIETTVRMLEEGETGVKNAYPRAVRKEGNTAARKMMEKVFRTTDRTWRGMGIIPESGLDLKPEYDAFNARKKYSLSDSHTEESGPCIAGEILSGRKKPVECPAFGTLCRPEKPLGAPMVSPEGACAAYFRYARTA